MTSNQSPNHILKINLDDLPLTLDITAGVIVFIFSFNANFCSIGIRPSIFELWFNTNLPNLKSFFEFYLQKFVSENLN